MIQTSNNKKCIYIFFFSEIQFYEILLHVLTIIENFPIVISRFQDVFFPKRSQQEVPALATTKVQHECLLVLIMQLTWGGEGGGVSRLLIQQPVDVFKPNDFFTTLQ